METIIKHPNTSEIYPGGYVPLHQREELSHMLKGAIKTMMACPPVNVVELTDSFKIEVAMPGLSREDIFINIDNEIISVRVYHQETKQNNASSFQLHEFDYNCLERNIILPENADAEFSSALYKDGLLIIYIPKATYSEKDLHTSIIVY
jgi:HSP20 family protein